MSPLAAKARSRWASLGLNLLLALVSCLAALLVAEAAVRVAGLGSDQLLRDDPVLGVRFIESKSGLSQGACYRADVTINAEGWRSPAYLRAKPEGVYRVLVLGDSFMAGLQVGDEETFSGVLERRLNEAGLDRRVEVINFGVPSWSTDQQFLALREYGVPLDPDMVLLAFYAQNDVAEVDLSFRSATSNYPKPYFDIRDGQLVELPFSDPTPFPVRIGRRLAAPFRTYPLTRDALLTIPVAHRLLYALGIVGVVPQQTQSEGGGGSLWEWPDRWRRQIGVFELRPVADWGRAWAMSERLLARIRQEANRAGASFLLVNVASPIEVMPSSMLSRLLGERMKDVDTDRPSKVLAEIGERHGLDVRSLVPDFRKRIGKSETAFGDLFLSCDGHWTVAGHRLAAEFVVQDVTPRIRGTAR